MTAVAASRSYWLTLLLAVLLLAVCSLPLCHSVSPIVVRGKHLVDSGSGRRFLLQGVGYDYDVSNENVGNWRPAINALLTAAPHVNSIRLYDVDEHHAYDQFMTDMNRRAVYVIVPLTPSRGWCTLNRDGSPPLSSTTCYPSCLLSYAQHVINLFSPYPNVLMFTIGNEIINSQRRWRAAPCVKSFARDVRRFMQRCSREENSRVIPLLYAAADNAIPHFTAEENDRMKMDYLLCDAAAGGGRAAAEAEDAQQQQQEEAEDGGSIDVMGVNLFRFCSDSCTYHSCESAAITAAFASSRIPLVLSEFGCSPFIHHVNHTARAGVNPFLEARTLLSPPMSDTWSGGSAYSFGPRGGEQFAFFHGGGRELRGRVGTSRSCGWPDGICRIDMYEKELAAAEDRERERHRDDWRRAADGEAEEEAAAGDEAQSSAVCPVILGVDLTVADSRQGADGYELVPCQAGIGRAATEQETREDEEEQRAERQRQQREDDRRRKAADDGDDGGDSQPDAELPPTAAGRGQEEPEDAAGAQRGGEGGEVAPERARDRDVSGPAAEPPPSSSPPTPPAAAAPADAETAGGDSAGERGQAGNDGKDADDSTNESSAAVSGSWPSVLSERQLGLPAVGRWLLSVYSVLLACLLS